MNAVIRQALRLAHHRARAAFGNHNRDARTQREFLAVNCRFAFARDDHDANIEFGIDVRRNAFAIFPRQQSDV